jgi:pilus assembly protein Flp/PilA
MSETLMLWVGKAYARIEDLKREDGQALVEYGLILALVAVVCIAALNALGANVGSKLQYVADQIAGA